MGNWFVAPDTKVLGSDYGMPAGEWIEVKTSLTHGEAKRLETAGFRNYHLPQSVDPDAAPADASIGIDWAERDLMRMAVWIVDWSATDAKGKKLEPNRRNIEALSPQMAKVINAALDRHTDEVNEGNAEAAGATATEGNSTAASKSRSAAT